VSGIAVYVEGGGDNVQQKAELRTGLDALLKKQKDAARARKLGWKMVPCGGRNAAYDAFISALGTDPAATNILLVDSEEGVAAETGDRRRDAEARAAHLTRRDRWDLTAGNPECIHLMVQCMEAWIVADPDALAQFYGQYFGRNLLPTRPNIEEEPKRDIYDKLDRATSDRRITKGQYGKIKHASQLLQRIEPSKLIPRCPRFFTFTQWLGQAIANA
jgi:hypothetical protein